MGQSPSRGSIPNAPSGNHVSGLRSSVSQPILSSGIAGGLLARNGLPENFGINHHHAPELRGNSYPLAFTSSKGVFQEEGNSETKVSRGYGPSYDIFNELNQNKTQQWNYNANSSVQGNLDVLPSALVQHGFSPSGQLSGLNRNSNSIGKAIFSGGEGSELINPQNMGQQFSSVIPDNSPRVKNEGIPEANCENTLFPESFGQEDLMSILFKQVSFSSVYSC